MQILALVWGILAVIGLLIGVFPCLGWLNWLNIPFAAAGLVVGLLASSKTTDTQRGAAWAGVVCCVVAVVVGALRLALGHGIV